MRKILVVIERRADYSRYRSILQKLKNDPFFKIHIVVTGICLLKDHGSDIVHILEDGFEINSKIPMFMENVDDSGAEMVRAMSRFMQAITYELEKTKPDIVLSGFDIGANFAVTVTAAHMNIPVAHIQGGEISGSIDESIRHAMSKFAHIHFPATELSKARLVRMGENPKHIYVVGCPSIDALVSTPTITKSKLEEEFMVDFSQPVILMIQHPVTTENTNAQKQINETLEALKNINVQTIIIFPNNDAGYSSIIKKIIHSPFKYYPTIPLDKYVNLLRNVSVLIGNSSSGIHEAATFKLPVVNIGTRQKGRESAANILDVPYDTKRICDAITKTLFDNTFRDSLKSLINPYGTGNTAEKIVQVLKTISLKGIVQKNFYE